MRNYNQNRYLPRKKHGRTLVVLLALFFAIGIPVAVLLTRQALYSAEESSSSETETTSSEPEEPVESETQSEEESSEPEPEPPRYGMVEESEAVGQDYFDDAVFFGDSITSGISAYALMSNAEVIASTGVNPDSVFTKEAISIEGSETRITMMEALRQAQPGKIYIMLGANWVGENTGIEEETFLKHYRTMLEGIKEQHPESLIYVQSMLPVSRAFDTNENGNNSVGLTNDLICTYNEALAELAEEEEVYYLDVHSAMVDDEGYLPDEATSDGMHITPDYYQKWFDYLKTHTVQTDEGEVSSEESSESEEDGTENEAEENTDEAKATESEAA